MPEIDTSRPKTVGAIEIFEDVTFGSSKET
jgi:hypothetical protein